MLTHGSNGQRAMAYLFAREGDQLGHLQRVKLVEVDRLPLGATGELGGERIEHILVQRRRATPAEVADVGD